MKSAWTRGGSRSDSVSFSSFPRDVCQLLLIRLATSSALVMSPEDRQAFSTASCSYAAETW
jgi:hypothetical protein